MAGLTLCGHRQGGVDVLTVAGELDVWSGPQLGESLAGLAALGRDRVVLDAVGLGFCDAFGIRSLVAGAAGARGRHGWLRLAGVNRQLSRVLVIAGVSGVLPMFDSVQDAIAGVRDSPGPRLARDAGERLAAA